MPKYTRPMCSTPSTSDQGAKMAAAMPASVTAHSSFSSRGRCSFPKRQVNRQKLWLNSKKTSKLPRATARVSGKGQASVARILARNSAQQKALSAYQPKALLARRCSQAKANSTPSTSETTMFMANSVRWFHQVSACHWRSASRSEEHTSELQSQSNLVCRLLLEKKKKKYPNIPH